MSRFKRLIKCDELCFQAHLDNTMDSDTTEEASAAHLKHERRTSGDFKNGTSNEVNEYMYLLQ